MGMGEIDADVLQGLADKVDSLDLTDQESEVLAKVLQRAASVQPEVEGFGVTFQLETTFKGTDEELQVARSPMAWGRALGFHIHVNPSRYIGETEKN